VTVSPVVTVTPNPALDVTYVVDELRRGATHRVLAATTRAGGKGLNVAHVLDALAVPVVATGPVGGAEGAELRSRLASDGGGVVDRLVTIGAPTRRTLTILDSRGGTATLLNEAGPTVSAAEWAALLDRVRELLDQAGVLVCSGSLPPGAPPGAPGDIVGLAREAGVPVIVDTSGQGLVEAVAAGATVVKPNADELSQATGISDPRAAAAALRAPGVAVVASLGAHGLLAVTDDGVWTARLPRPVTGNATGAGDSVVAALAAGIRSHAPWPTLLRAACALSAATVLAPVAGVFDAESYDSLLPAVEIREVER
jgi:tagatose 6-phosphate kinase